MYLRNYKMKDGDKHLSIVHSYRDNNKKISTKTIKTFGRLTKLTEEWKMSSEQVLKECERITKEKNDNYRKSQEPKYIEIKEGLRVSENEDWDKYIGDAIPLGFYNQLNIENTIRNSSRKSKEKFDLNAICRLLVTERLFNPSSKKAAWENRNKHFYKSEFLLHDVYRGVKKLAAHKPKIIRAMNASIGKNNYNRTLSNVFYDVTNYYFEGEETDLLKEGYSKEHQPKPLVQMGLLQDKNAIPIGYKLFPGNTNDSQTLLPILNDMKEEFKLSRVVVVADKGNNCSKNIAATYANGDGFVFSQSIRGTKSDQKLRNWVISDKGYRAHGKDFKIKSKITTKKVHISKDDSADGKQHDVDIPVKIVAFWSRKYEERARYCRKKTIERAEDIIDNPGKYSTLSNKGAMSLINKTTVAKETGEIDETEDVLQFDYDQLRQYEECDGYYCIVTSEIKMSDDKIIKTYQNLWHIEESFKISKSDLKARPAFMTTEDGLEGHFLICYIALTIARMMQFKLNHKYSVSKMFKDLEQCKCVYADSNMWLFGHRKKHLTDDLYKLVGFEPQKKWMELGDIKKMFSKSVLPK